MLCWKSLIIKFEKTVKKRSELVKQTCSPCTLSMPEFSPFHSDFLSRLMWAVASPPTDKIALQGDNKCQYLGSLHYMFCAWMMPIYRTDRLNFSCWPTKSISMSTKTMDYLPCFENSNPVTGALWTLPMSCVTSIFLIITTATSPSVVPLHIRST